MNAVGLASLLVSSAMLDTSTSFSLLSRQNNGRPIFSNIQPINSLGRKGRVNQPTFLRDSCPISSTQLPMAFVQTGSVDIPSIRTRLDVYEDKETGAKHIHYLPADNTSEKAFSVVLKTVPKDSTGVAHILEHSVLAGSQKYPVKDPFFSMMRRSLATFLNAMTSSDWTQYPFATQNTKDFFNLLSVYNDAVFFPLLDREVFAQEGHRLEFEDPYNTTSPLTYNGVVYNEMIGAMGSVVSDIGQKLASHLFPDTTYHYNSGGDPKVIPNLTYDQFLKFHEDHYNPSNAAFITYGDIPIEEFHDQLEKQVLSKFEGKNPSILLPTERTLVGPKQVIETYAYDGRDCENKTHHIVGWVLGQSGHARESLEASFLARVLLGNSASPLQHFLDKYPHASAPSALNGLDEHAARMSFMCGIEGSGPEWAEDFEKALLATIEKVTREGVPQPTLEAVCHQMELSQREVKDAVSSLFKLLPTVVYGSDPKAVLDMDASLNYLAEQIKDPGYIKQLAKTLLLDNSHRVRLTAIPDPELNAKKQQEKREKLDSIRGQLSPDQVDSLVAQSKALEARQSRIEDSSVLPKLSLSDIPAEVQQPKATLKSSEMAVVLNNGNRAFAAPEATVYQTTTNGIGYVNIVMPLPKLTEQETRVFPVYESVLMSLGVGLADYLEMQQRQSAITGGLGCFSGVKTSLNSRDDHMGYFGIGTKALSQNLEKAIDLLTETFSGVRFDEPQRIKELIKKDRLSSEQGITQVGHQLAMLAAASHHSSVSHLEHTLEGLGGIAELQKIDDSIQDSRAMNELVSVFRSIHTKLQASPKFSLAMSDLFDARSLMEMVKLKQPNASAYTPFHHSAEMKPGNEVWVTQTESNYCAKAYSGVEESHPDSAALKVMAALLTWENLHTSVRESGGAYGGGASYDQKNGVINFYSYRDPRNLETLDDFDRSVDWLLNTELTSDMLEQAKLSTIGGLDRPGTPATEASKAFFTEVEGRDIESVSAFRESVLKVSAGDLKRVAETYLKSRQGSIAIITSESGYRSIRENSNIDFERFDV